VLKCPYCGSTNVRKSRRANASVVFPVTLFFTWVRCCGCWRKFGRFGLLPDRWLPKPTEDSTEKKHLRRSA
jgi:hypothetical protein